MNPLTACLILSAILFTIGLAGALLRRNAIIVLISIELMLNAANLNFLAFWKYGPNPEALNGVMFVPIFHRHFPPPQPAGGFWRLINFPPIRPF